MQSGDGVANTGDELSTRPSALTPIPSTGLLLGNGKYVVKVSDDPADTDGNPNADSNGRIVITSTGSGQNGATSTTEVIIGSTTSPGRLAILADGDFSTSNEINVKGPNASAHANRSFSNSSEFCVENKISHGSVFSMNLSKITSGSACSTAGTVGVNVFYNQPKITPEIYDVPTLQIIFRPQADYILKGNGTIIKKGSAITMTAAEITAAGLSDWVWDSGKKWKWGSGSLISDGIYYAEGSNLEITNGGNNTTPPKITLIAEGAIEISNGPSFQPKLLGFALVSGNDIKITSQIGVSGNPGLVYSYGQMEVTNQSTFYGWLQAANFRRNDGTNGFDENDPAGGNLVQGSSKGALRISNKTTVNAPNGGGSGGNNITVISKREVRY